MKDAHSHNRERWDIRVISDAMGWDRGYKEFFIFNPAQSNEDVG